MGLRFDHTLLNFFRRRSLLLSGTRRRLFSSPFRPGLGSRLLTLSKECDRNHLIQILDTVEGEWLEVFVPFNELKQSWRGRKLSGYTFDASKIERIGIMLADKKAGVFRMTVDWIAAGKN